MRTGKREVTLIMVERFEVEQYDLRRTPFMVGVAMVAIMRLRFARPPVKTGRRKQIAFDLFVTIEAKFDLRTFRKIFVTIRAVLLQVGMRLGQISGQDQPFEQALRICPRRHGTAKRHQQDRNDMANNPRHSAL